MKKIITLLLLAGQITESAAQLCDPLDTRFGVNGKATGMSFHNYGINSRNIMVQPDDKIIQINNVYGLGSNVIRYTREGRLDSTFALDGIATVFNGSDSYANFGALQADGKVVVVGRTMPFGDYYTSDIILVRFNSDGTLDNSFGIAGKVMTSISSYSDEGNGLVILPNGKIIVAGYTSTNCFNDCFGNLFCIPSFAILRYNSNGSIDSTFGEGGKSVIPGDSVNGSRAFHILIQPDGKIVAVGEMLRYYCDDYYGGQYYSPGSLMARFDTFGIIDSSFGTKGIVKDTTELTTSSAAIVQKDGKIVVAGSYIQGGSTIKRYQHDGKPDNSFIPEKFNGWINAIEIRADGKIILGGSLYNGYGTNILIASLKKNGSLDSSFGGNGILQIPGQPNTDVAATGLATQKGQIVVGAVSQYYNFDIFRADQLALRLKDSVDIISVSVDRAGSLFPCPGETVVLSVNQAGTIEWFKDGQLTGGGIGSAFNVNTSGIYSVRITNSGNCGQSEEIPVSFNGLPVDIFPDGSLNICDGDSVKLVSSEAGTVRWFKNGIEISGATDTAYFAKTEGYYSVYIKNSNGCGQSSYVYVYSNTAKPSISWSGSTLQTVCCYYDYQWFLNGNAIPGSNESFYQPSEPGLYKVVIADYGCNNTSEEFNFDCNVISIPTPPIAWDGIRLNTQTGYSKYQWSLNGNIISGIDTHFFQPVEMGTYKVSVTDIYNCSNNSGEFVLSCDVAGPSKPAVDWNGSQFTTGTGYTAYQWYHNDTAIAGATSNTYKPATTQFGDYRVVVKNNFNCSISSDSRPYRFTALNNLTWPDATLRFYPNPVTTTIYIDVSMLSNKKMVAALYDLSGKKLRQETLKHGRNELQVDQLNSGMYQLQVQYGFERKVLKIVVIK